MTFNQMAFFLNSLPNTGEKSYFPYIVGLIGLAVTLLLISFFLRRKGSSGPKKPTGPRAGGPKGGAQNKKGTVIMKDKKPGAKAKGPGPGPKANKPPQRKK
ncbi:MAG: LPXTG cell wall anchor domain-containing protein [Eubacteriales bacterium]|nr:LPXTG cell wall anchor domain-containing protein [Eubacteriales bacterium]